MPDIGTEQEDRDLIRRIASQDALALEAFYDRYNRLSFGLVMRIVGNRTDAEDVLMDTFWQIWQQASRYDSSRGKPLAWLLTIARTRAIDCVRSTTRHQSKDENLENLNENPQPGPTPDLFVVADTQSAVNEALQTLSEQQRVPLEMAYFRGMSHTEIARALGQPLGTVKDRIRNGMAHLKKRLKAYV